ncbi:MAG: hypothetical protein COV59_04160 [Candidatus Magasanikbacteria bacterium CG11_big_fil_rev_8_21_14_0_20_39_34]|uniref:Nudix hydrolase domain-containing protein n=1 Tax=Candidatus Magasanikbacteria bacterium CG11_big_fil_rev_8_21_14_0_20_39_34 TaxID=1974653 RepID=A0A2H0N4L4_9BACT|nr:MAG: hypothetical protein COV59_04160 [Candidatus Magasanikbacteria bacterium CG11_big_fil_rev_8_21_14_0_20_39_34]
MGHIHEKVDFTSEVFVFFEDKVLLRKHDKYHLWLGAGGHIELHEDPNQAAIREVKEEVGLDIILVNPTHTPLLSLEYSQDLVPPFFMNRHKINDTHEHVCLIYAGITHDDTLTLSETEKSESCQWLTRQDVIENTEIQPHIKKYVLYMFEKLSQAH